MLVFGAVFALPFFLLALFPKKLSSLPRSGGWLTGVKVVLGFVEIAAAFKFLSVVPIWFGSYYHLEGDWNILFRELVLGIWAVTSLAVVAYLFGWIRFPHDSPVKGYSPGRLALVATFLVLAGYFAVGATGRLLNSNIEGQLTASIHKHSDLPWRVLEKGTSDFDAELAAARGGEKPIFINFTGHT